MGIVVSRFFVVSLITCMFFVSCKRAVYSGGAQDNLHLNVRVKYSADVEGAEARVAYVVRNAGDSTLVIPSDIAGYLDIEIESYGRSAVRLPEPGVKHPLGKTLSSVLVLLPGMVLSGEVQLAKVSFESMSKEYSRLAFTYHEQGMDFLKASNGVFYALPGKGRFEVSGVLLSLPMVSSPYFDPDDGRHFCCA